MFLITYQCERKGVTPVMGYSFAAEPHQFLESVQEYKDETYYIVNVLEVPYDWYKRVDGTLKGQ